jgi:hypothetical protein
MAREIDRLTSWLERELITPSEFFNSMLEALGNLPAGEKQVILGALASHSSERVREGVVPLEAFVRNQELSRDFEHVRRNSPLRPGTRLELFGDGYSSDARPVWLSGRECRGATFVRFERQQGENLAPVALVEFDDAIDTPGHKRRYGILFARYGCDYHAWELPEGPVVMSVVERLPNDPEDSCGPDPFTERYARYLVKETPDEPGGSNG